MPNMITVPCTMCPAHISIAGDALRVHMSDVHPDVIRAVYARRERDTRRRRAAERGEDWTKVQ